MGSPYRLCFIFQGQGTIIYIYIIFNAKKKIYIICARKIHIYIYALFKTENQNHQRNSQHAEEPG